MSTIQILIVEDDPKIADLHRRFTERVTGCEVVGIATSLDDAHEMVEALEPDLILLDLYFPEGTGMDLLHFIRSRDMETDIILITAAREVDPLKQALRGGVFDYIIKPVITERFNACLENFRRYRARLSGCDTIEQLDVDRIRQPGPACPSAPAAPPLPKGIDALTLGKVRGLFQDAPRTMGLSAEDAGARIGASRSTARRYLEYLVSVSFVYADVVYGSVGRPERKYFRA